VTGSGSALGTLVQPFNPLILRGILTINCLEVVNWVKVAKSDGGVVDCLTRIWCLRTKMMGARNIRPVMEMEAYVD